MTQPQRVRLEAWDVDRDVPAYEKIVCTPEVSEFLGEPDHDPVPQGPLFGHGDDYVMVTGAVWCGDDLVGAVWLSWWRHTGDEAATVTVAVRPDARGNGYGRAAVAEAAKLARSVHPGLPISGVVKADNAASMAMVARLGGGLVPDRDDPDYLVVVPEPTEARA